MDWEISHCHRPDSTRIREAAPHLHQAHAPHGGGVLAELSPRERLQLARGLLPGRPVQIAGAPPPPASG